MEEVRDIYLPLSRLINLYVNAVQRLYGATDTFLGRHPGKVPYLIGVAGSVAVGKSTTSRVLRALLARWPDHPKVDLITTDGFLLPNRDLVARGLLQRKGFPESYDVRKLLRFVTDLKSGREEVSAPVYSHLTYDIVPSERVVIRRPDIVIVEGLNVLQTWRAGPRTPTTFVSDYFDFSIYVDADEEDVERWYVERFLTFRETAFKDPANYFHKYSSLTVPEAVEVARGIWREINGVNLRENIAPTRERADLILAKAGDHSVREVKLRRL